MLNKCVRPPGPSRVPASSHHQAGVCAPGKSEVFLNVCRPYFKPNSNSPFHTQI